MRSLSMVGAFLVSGIFLNACQSAPTPASVHHAQEMGGTAEPRHAGALTAEQWYTQPAVIDLAAMPALEAIIVKLAPKRVVYVGERHDRYDHHLNQLQIITRLHAYNPNLAIGLEFFQQPFQAYLDAFVEGRIGEKEFLRKTEYYERWRFDYRLYRPILSFAREQRIPVIALNVPTEITAKVGREGLESLTEEERAQIPRDMDRSNETYSDRLRIVFEQHPGGDRQFENFLSVQLLWDEGMADRAAQFLRENPGRQLVVLAGSGHLEYGRGIPDRVARRLGNVESAIVLQGLRAQLDPEMADYLLLPEEQRLPVPGKLGAFLDTGEEGVTVQSFGQSSAAQEAGIEEGDRIVTLDGEPVRSYADVKVALWDKLPGDDVTVEVRRKRVLLSPKALSFSVNLR